jgi:hypothetical protein
MFVRTFIAWAGWLLFVFGCVGSDVDAWATLVGIGLLVQALILKIKAD